MEHRRVVALGFFDGVHLGHAGLMEMARRRADELGLPAAVMTFSNHPDNLVRGIPTPLINSRAECDWLMKTMYHMDEVLFYPFDRDMMQMSREDFIRTILVEELHVAHVVCGYDYSFGHRGQGTASYLAQCCAELGIGCDIVDRIVLDGITISSTHIRTLIEAGDMEEARRFLGHNHCIVGTVIHGNALGRRLGSPTANLLLDADVLAPKLGVYISRVHTPLGTYAAVTNVGCRPTVDGAHVVVEPWLLDFSGDLYDREICVELCRFLRSEKKFESLEALQDEISRNAQQTMAYFAAMDRISTEVAP